MGEIIPWKKLSMVVLNQTEAIELNNYFKTYSDLNEEISKRVFVKIGKDIVKKVRWI
ncbi:hypothetical protein K502DRAFT_324565, partial [Neoconidiobolus thromboides FSU 785]